MVHPAFDPPVGLTPGHVGEDGQQDGSGEGEADLAAEREAEPEPRAAVVEHRAQEPPVPEPRDRIHDPQCPYGEDQADQILVPWAAGPGLPWATGQEPAGGKPEIAQEGIGERDHQGHVADEDLFMAKKRVEVVAGVGNPEVNRAVLRQRADPHRRHGVEDRPTPTEVSAGPPEESQSEQGDVPSSDERAIDLMQLALLSPTRSFAPPSKTFL